MEMDAENAEDESYYLSNSPIRRGNNINTNNRNIINKNNKSSALSNNPSSFGQGDIVVAGNQQNQGFHN